VRVPVVVLVLLSIPALVSPQSLGDAARQQAKKRAAPAPAAKSYSDADLPAKPEEQAPKAPETTPSPAAEMAGERPADSARGEAAAQRPPRRATAQPGAALPMSEEEVRRQLDAEAAERKRQETHWRGLCRDALNRIEQAQRAYDTLCGPNKLASG
jgi:hypothetical protein